MGRAFTLTPPFDSISVFHPTVPEVTGFDVREIRTLVFQGQGSRMYELQCAVPPATDVWTEAGLTIQGQDGPVFAFDPAESEGSSTGKLYRAVHTVPAP